jgi:hypothetical protein
MMNYSVKVFEEIIEFEDIISYQITQEGYLQLTQTEGVVAYFKDWSYFVVTD